MKMLIEKFKNSKLHTKVLIVGILTSILSVDVGAYVITLAIVLWIFNLVKSKKVNKDRGTHYSPAISKNTIKTFVAGIAYEGRNKMIDGWLSTIKKPYSGKSDEKMMESNRDRFYKYTVTEELNAINLIPEPTNPYDKDAIKIVHTEIGHIGYVPKEDTAFVHNALKSKNIAVHSLIKRGPFKEVEIDEVVENDDNFVVELEIQYQ